MRAALLSAATIGMMFGPPLRAHDVITTNLTFARDISRIFARRCLACHGPGSSIPLTSYSEARPWAVDIKDQVLARAMPPWGAVKGFGKLSPDRALSQEEILIIAAWVVGGAPQGDPALLPKPGPLDSPEILPALRDALTISTRTTLDRKLVARGIRPVPREDVFSARIIARLPDGRIEPLVWLYSFPAKADRTFYFREPLELPTGTVVEASAPLQFALETAAAPEVRAPSPGR